MKKRKFADGGALDELASGKAKGSFDQDVYSRARAFLERGNKGEDVAETKRVVRSVRPKPSAPDTGDETARMARRAPAPPAAVGRAEIPVDRSLRAPAPEGRIPGELERNIRNTAAALTPMGVGAAMRVGAPLAASAVQGYRAGRPAAALARSTPRVGDEALESAVSAMSRRPVQPQVASAPGRFSPKQEVEAAESTMRGAASRRALRAKRDAQAAARTAAKKEDVVRRRSEPTEMGYAKGGSIDGCARRGKTKGTMR